MLPQIAAKLRTLSDRRRPTSGDSSNVIVIEPARGWVALRLRDVWEYRELLYFLTWRDVKVRYKQTVLGAAWAIIQPFFTMVIFSLFFGRPAKMPSDGLAKCGVGVCVVPWKEAVVGHFRQLGTCGASFDIEGVYGHTWHGSWKYLYRAHGRARVANLLRRLEEIVRAHRPELVHLHYTYSDFPEVYKQLQLDIPLLLTATQLYRTRISRGCAPAMSTPTPWCS